MEETVPVVDAKEPGVPATIELDDGTHLHVRLQPSNLVNGGVLVPCSAIEKAHRGEQALAVHEALGVDERHLQKEHTIWIPGHRLRVIILASEAKRPRPIGFGA
ncbi:MAG TPA: hypothetical protein VIK92_06140 [Thermaerobacter sp.]